MSIKLPDAINYQVSFDEGTLAHYVEGKLVADGDELELRLADKHWATVTYYKKPHAKRGAHLYLSLANGWGGRMHLSPGMQLRWPQEDA